ncbi:MAG: nucleotidyltransferase family protein [Salinibacter sp.]
MSLSDDALRRYRQTRRRRDAAARAQQEAARRTAWQEAREAAALLNTDLGAERVILFGSVAWDDRLSPHSDLDLAVTGLSGLDYYRAVARVQSVPETRSVDLIRLASCRPSLRDTIQDTGIEL